MTRTIRIVSQTQFGQQTEFRALTSKTDAPDVSKLITVTTSTLAPVQLELSSENRQHLMTRIIRRVSRF
eukprot:8898888-Pyramimonas_sp.AAC.1